MIYEKLDLQLDIARLKRHYERVVLRYPPVTRPDQMHGWSVLSASSDYRDGWVRPGDEPGSVRCAGRALPKGACLPVTQVGAYFRPTQICTGYLEEVIETIRRIGLFPRRARLSLLRAGRQTPLHLDVRQKQAIRLHIPLITNPLCRFESAGKSVHFPADGSGYLVRVDIPHRVVNRGASDRVHLVMRVFDMAQITKRHRFPAAWSFK